MLQSTATFRYKKSVSRMNECEQKATPADNELAASPVMMEQENGPTRLSLFTFSSGQVLEHPEPSLQSITEFNEQQQLLWLNVEGLLDQNLINGIAQLFSLHPLAIEDLNMVQHRPKAESYDNCMFVVMRALLPQGRCETEQFSLFLGSSFLITVQERQSSVVKEVVRRLNQSHSSLPLSADRLAYEVIDALLDEYFPAFEGYAERLEQIECDLLDGRIHFTLANIRALKREIMVMRKAIWPMREVVNNLIHGDNELISEKVRVYLRDCQDHIFHLMDLAETYREVAADISDIYISAVSARLNETMKVLTILSTIFMPLSFIASLYGMNFDTDSPFNMPELKWPYGYPFALGLMLLTVLAMLGLFYKKGWIGRRRDAPGLLKEEDIE